MGLGEFRAPRVPWSHGSSDRCGRVKAVQTELEEQHCSRGRSFNLSSRSLPRRSFHTPNFTHNCVLHTHRAAMGFEYHLLHEEPTGSSLAYIYVEKHTSSSETIEELQDEVWNEYIKSFTQVKPWSTIEIRVYKVVHPQDLSEYL